MCTECMVMCEWWECVKCEMSFYGVLSSCKYVIFFIVYLIKMIANNYLDFLTCLMYTTTRTETIDWNTGIQVSNFTVGDKTASRIVYPPLLIFNKGDNSWNSKKCNSNKSSCFSLGLTQGINFTICYNIALIQLR